MKHSFRDLALFLSVTASTTLATAAEPFAVSPSDIRLDGNFERVQLVVTQTDAADRVTDTSADLTADATYTSADPSIVSVNKHGQLLGIANGETKLTIKAGDRSLERSVVVSGIEENPATEFVRDIAPILTKAGCNMGACHATQYGQGGFKLSVFGFDPSADHDAIIRDRHQRRVNMVAPEQSLFLLKPAMAVPHGGGKRLAPKSVEHQTLVAWLKNGAPAPMKEPAAVKSLSVFPKQRVGQQGLSQQLRVEATYADGTIRDVTALSLFDSMDEAMLDVSETGFVRTHGKGQAPIMVRFEGQAGIAMFVVPYDDSVELAGWQNNNFIDELAAKKFRELGIEPSPLCDDATFVRRAFLDATGSLPTIEQTAAFHAKPDPNKREQLIDELLGLTGDPLRDVHNDNYAAWWTLKWSDLIRNTSNGGGQEQAMWSMHNWMKEAFRTNRTFDKVVRELVTAKGSTYSNGPANYFRIFGNTTDLTESTAQLFLGVRLECAKCHHHPFEKYGQDDYYAFSAFFSRVGTKRSEEFGLFGNESVVIVKTSGEASNPRTRKRMEPTPLEGEPTDHPLDRRIALADWLTAKDNTYFARSIVNRYMSYLLGRGLVEPVDDLRSTNPPTNPELMGALAKHFAESGFDLKQLIRVIMTSRLYQLDSQPTEQNVLDQRFYSHYHVKRLPAEPLLDAIDQVTGSPTKFKNLPAGTRATELPDAEYPNYFLNTFAKPRRASVCECERSPDENLVQALHTLNGDTLTTKLADSNGRIARLINEKKSAEAIVQELYHAALCRPPSDAELQTSIEYVKESPTPQEGYEDILWGLMNSKYFLFVY
ncbi:MAG: DUF1553 domain-containing protein [Planctomycetota bacterium]|nr:DUF1553 domain-containing protein [Planctomycetota bacterium]MDA0919894.1 DUF1553 domain-containing protein [Planctomycetota bacterium]